MTLAPTRAAVSTWIRVCALADLEIERGRAALVEGTQIALFVLRGADGGVGRIHAVSNLDPYSGANVMSRGIVGTRQDSPTVASPMYKQVFDLRTGYCLETQGEEPRALRVWPTVVEDDHVLIKWEANS